MRRTYHFLHNRPVDFLGSEDNRFSFALAYGAMAASVTNLFLTKLNGKEGGLVVELEGPPWTSGKMTGS